MCRGEDTEFYLSRGYRVIGIEANPALVASLHEKFAKEEKSGQLIIVDKAIANQTGRVRFVIYPGALSWGSMSAKFNERNAALGHASQEVEVEAVPFDDVLQKFGIPYYLKVDIEGLDMLCIEALHRFTERPRYVSLETAATAPASSVDVGFAELAHLWVLGYRQFKYVDQRSLEELTGTVLQAEGPPLSYVHREGSSGPFGEETPGPWLGIDVALREMHELVKWQDRYGFGGAHSQRLASRIIRRARHMRHTWYDLHARVA
jgi:FkbM family methyltransferase